MERSWGHGAGAPAGLERHLCQIGGLNQNYLSRSGTLYHIQIEDRGPIVDRLSDREVRRVNVIVYANYGEPNARIIHGRDHDYPDIRSQEHNSFVRQQVRELAVAARTIIEEREQRNIERIKGQIRQYYLTKSEATKKEFEQTNALYPFLFSRAWRELRNERVPSADAPRSEAPDDEASPEVVYPLDAARRERVLEIERIIAALGRDLDRLLGQGRADEALVRNCGKQVTHAKAVLAHRETSEFNARRLDTTRNSLLTTWRQVRSMFKG